MKKETSIQSSDPHKEIDDYIFDRESKPSETQSLKEKSNRSPSKSRNLTPGLEEKANTSIVPNRDYQDESGQNLNNAPSVESQGPPVTEKLSQGKIKMPVINVQETDTSQDGTPGAGLLKRPDSQSPLQRATTGKSVEFKEAEKHPSGQNARRSVRASQDTKKSKETYGDEVSQRETKAQNRANRRKLPIDKNPFGKAAGEDRAYVNPKELEMFDLETKSRKTIAELLKPVWSDMEVDRKTMAEIAISVDKYERRLHQVEFLLGVHEVKPQIFQDYDNLLNDQSLRITQEVYELKANQTLQQSQIDKMNSICKDVEESVRMFEEMLKINKQLFDDLTKRTQTDSERITKEIMDLAKAQDTLANKTDTQLVQFDFTVKAMGARVVEFDAVMQQIQKTISYTNDKLIQTTADVSVLKERKLDEFKWAEQVKSYSEQLETVRYATYDNFRALRQTDNFLEKYLPFQIQSMISTNMLSVVKNPQKCQIKEMAGKEQLTPEEAKQHNEFKAFKLNEYLMYKELHKAVLLDDGSPTIKKTAFRMPGYRQVLPTGESEMEVGEMDYGDIQEEDSDEQKSESSGDAVSPAKKVMKQLAKALPKYMSARRVQSQMQRFLRAPVFENEVAEDKLELLKAQQVGQIANMMGQTNAGADKQIKRMAAQADDMQSSKVMERLLRHMYPADVAGQVNTTQTDQSISQEDEYGVEQVQMHPESVITSEPSKQVSSHSISSEDGGDRATSIICEEKDISLPPQSTTGINRENMFGSEIKPNNRPDSIRDTVARQPVALNSAMKSQNTSRRQLRDPNRRVTMGNLRHNTTEPMMDNSPEKKLSGLSRSKTIKTRTSRSPLEQSTANLSTYHKRRQQTGYLVGFKDMEPEICDMLTQNNTGLATANEKLDNLGKELIDTKRWVELVMNQRDLGFQKEVRICLEQQFTYVQEIQQSQIAEYDNFRDQLKQISWQIVQLQEESDINKQKEQQTSNHGSTNESQLERTGKRKKETNNTDLMAAGHEYIIDAMKLQNILNWEYAKFKDSYEARRSLIIDVNGPGSDNKLQTHANSQKTELLPKSQAKSTVGELNSETGMTDAEQDKSQGALVSAAQIQVTNVDEHETLPQSEGKQPINCSTLVQMLDKIRSQYEAQLGTTDELMAHNITLPSSIPMSTTNATSNIFSPKSLMSQTLSQGKRKTVMHRRNQSTGFVQTHRNLNTRSQRTGGAIVSGRQIVTSGYRRNPIGLQGVTVSGCASDRTSIASVSHTSAIKTM